MGQARQRKVAEKAAAPAKPPPSTKTKPSKTSPFLYLVPIILLLGLGYLFLLPNAGPAATHTELSSEALTLRGDNFSLAITTTWRGVPMDWAEAWLQWHLALGFDRAYLFFDDPKFDREVIDALSASPLYKDYLYITESNSTYREKYWTPCEANQPCDRPKADQDMLPMLGAHLDTEHTARQMLYTTRSAQQAAADNVDWLLHIDSDELFHLQDLDLKALDNINPVPNKAGNARDLFKELSSRRYTHAAFFNDENLPENPNFTKKNLLKTPFHQITLFKKNPIIMTGPQLGAKQRWENEHDGNGFFLGYMCGKGAVNIKRWHKVFGKHRYVQPMHVVRFAVNEAHAPRVADIINQGMDYFFPAIDPKKVKIAAHVQKAIVLHYVNSNLDALRVKFEGRKQFNKLLFDENLVPKDRAALFQRWRTQWHPSEGMPSETFYNNMWEKVQQDVAKGISARSAKSAALALYKQAALAPGPTRLNELLNTGAVYRTKVVRELLQRVKKDVDAAGTNGSANPAGSFVEQIVAKVKELVLGPNQNAGSDKANASSTQSDLSPGMKSILRIRQRLARPAGAPKPRYGHCADRAPHYECDVDNCCYVFRSPQFTYEKRQLGYKRLAANEWWIPSYTPR
eukprot:comp22767_c0_seq1/m.35594 comp22767_c0_seq1/g.35594  ORF comp22767_c0_seq1/g.35594 comp22767_c0_seq1/m.35594 type:complete len:628 (-) comp22767_c0_seq1:530-2413(-)